MRATPLVLAIALLLAGCAFGPGPEQSGHVPTPPTGTGNGTGAGVLELERVASGLASPLLATHAGDDRLFIVEQGGKVKILRDGRLLPAPFLDVSALTRAGGERGLLGLAFAPDFETSGRLYVSYTDTAGTSKLARYRVSERDPDRVDAGSAEVLLSVEQPYANHNGGHLAFGADGYLYYGLGDGGSGGDPEENGQDPTTLLGAMLRLDVSPDTGYAIPPDNPYADGARGRPEIWAIGLRNPWRFSFDRATGDLYVADVGQNVVEEINFQPASSPGGENYGWNVWEGSRRYRSGDAISNVTFPVAQYSHRETGGCSITGGYVYRGEDLPGLRGTYLFSDYCAGTLWGLRATEGEWRRETLLETGLAVSSFGEDARGEVYVVDHKGAVHRIVRG